MTIKLITTAKTTFFIFFLIVNGLTKDILQLWKNLKAFNLLAWDLKRNLNIRSELKAFWISKQKDLWALQNIHQTDRPQLSKITRKTGKLNWTFITYKSQQPWLSYCFKVITKTFISDGDLGTTDYVAIAVSLGMTVFILAAIVFFLWRARNRSEMGTNNTSGRVSIKFSKATFNVGAGKK